MKNLKMRGGASPRKMGRVGDRLCCASPIFFHLTPTEAMVVWCVRFWWWWAERHSVCLLSLPSPSADEERHGERFSGSEPPS